MATLNGVEFQILTIEWATYQNNVIQEVIGGDTVVVHSQGYRTDPVKIQGRVRNEKELDAFQEEFYSGGALTFIKDVNSGRQYQIYTLGNIKQEDSSNDKSQTGIVFNCLVKLAYPYMESSEITTRSKTITTQNQEWSADDDSNDIKTNGNVDAVPDIKIECSLEGDSIDASNTTYNAGLDLNANGRWIGQSFTTAAAAIALNAISITINIFSASGELKLTLYKDYTKATILGTKKMIISGTGEQKFVFDTPIGIVQSTQYYFEVYHEGSSFNGSPRLQTTGNPYAGGRGYDFSSWLTANSDIVFKTYIRGTTKTINPIIYNNLDSTVKCNIANSMLYEAIHYINVDGTGTIDYDDNFVSGKWKIDSTYLNITHDTIDDEIDIADDGYIYWKKDTKYPINGIPTLTSRINITSGIPTIQISTDASTWYDIDTTIVDDVEIVYPLDSDGNLSLVGKTIFYFRMDCVKAAPATASIKYFELDINIHTIYAKNPKITKGSSVSTFRMDQDSSSGMACIIDLIYRDKWWV